MKSPISTHVLDTSRGKPAVGIVVKLEVQLAAGQWKELAHGETDADGRVSSLLPGNHQIALGVYKLTFETSAYFSSTGTQGFFPQIPVVFDPGPRGALSRPTLAEPARILRLSRKLGDVRSNITAVHQFDLGWTPRGVLGRSGETGMASVLLLLSELENDNPLTLSLQ
jgi:5-hydroxyisourate hydrolase